MTPGPEATEIDVVPERHGVGPGAVVVSVGWGSHEVVDRAAVYAQLLVSDIRLYHEEDVVTGRTRRDLLARLSGPIARARARFLSRFADPTPFDRELIRILASGDPSLLR